MKECPICLKEFNEELCKTNCSHEFCSNCLDLWFNKKRSDCPVCREPIKSFIYNNEKTKIIHIIENENQENINNHINELNSVFDTIGDVMSIRRLNMKLKKMLLFSSFINISYTTTLIYLYTKYMTD